MSKKKPIGDGRLTCLICGKEIKTGGGRGLCQNHNKQLRESRDTLTSESWEALESKMLELGLILPGGNRGRPPETSNPFRELAEEMRLEYTIDSEAQKGAEQALRQIGDKMKPKTNAPKRKQNEG